MRKIGATQLFPIVEPIIDNGVLVLDEQGKILAIDRLENHDKSSVDFYDGLLIPGLVNTHCHLELSHMKGLADTGTGLLPFLKKVVNFREFPEEVILEAIAKADREMYEAGIVAVGDISNKLDTAATKEKSSIRYYTFVEMFDFLQESQASTWFDQYKKVYDGQSTAHGNRKSCVPHAPYTVSTSLFELINQENEPGSTISIHNQETVHEDQFFLDKSGGFLDFYDSFGFSVEEFQPTGRTSIHYALEQMDPKQRTLFVHNTMITPPDIKAAQDWNEQVYWATCPNANLYIENRLPNYQHFLDTGAKMTIGTDSLTSNWQLSVFEEMKTIQKYQSYVPLETLWRWATLNGAEALGFADDFGSFEVGKAPGVNLIRNLEKEMRLGDKASIQRIQ